MRFDPGRERRLKGATRLQGNGRGIPERSMLLLQGHVSLLATFTTAEGLSVLLPKAMERLRLPSLLGVIVGGPTGLGVVLPNGPIITLLAEIGKLLLCFVSFEINLEEFNKALRVPGIWAETETTVKGNLLCKVDCTSGLR